MAFNYNSRFKEQVEEILRLASLIHNEDARIKKENDIHYEDWQNKVLKTKQQFRNSWLAAHSAFRSSLSNKEVKLETTLRVWETWRSKVGELLDSRNPPTNPQLGLLLENFNNQISALNLEMKTYYESNDPKEGEYTEVGYELRYAVESLSGVIEIQSDLKHKDGVGVFEDVCKLCNISIQNGLIYGKGEPRIHCLDCASTQCLECWEYFQFVLKIMISELNPSFMSLERFALQKTSIDSKNVANNDNTLSEGEIENENENENDELFQTILSELQTVNREILHRALTERNHPVLMRSDIFEYRAISLLLHNAFKEFENRPFLGTVRSKEVKYRSFGDVYKRILRISTGLQRDIPCNSFVAVTLRNSTMWYEIEAALILNMCTCCGIYERWSISDWHSIITNANIRHAIIDFDFAIKLFSSSEPLPSHITTIIVLHKVDLNDEYVEVLQDGSYYDQNEIKSNYCFFESQLTLFRKMNPNLKIISFRSLISFIADEVMKQLNFSESTSLCGLSFSTPYSSALHDSSNQNLVEQQNKMYPLEYPVYVTFSSGSTGIPKGVIMRSKTLLQEGVNLTQYHVPNISINFYPPCWGSAQQIFSYALFNGGSCAIFSDDDDSAHSNMSGSSSFFDACEVVNPSTVLLVPIICSTLKSEYSFMFIRYLHETIDHHSQLKNNDCDVVDDNCIQIRSTILEILGDNDITHSLCKLLTINDINTAKARASAYIMKRLGKNINTILVGGAKTNPSLLQFLKDHFQCSVIETYGTSECGGITVNNAIMNGVSVKLKDRPDLGYTTADLPSPRGEICVKSQSQIALQDWICSSDQNLQIRERYDEEGYFMTGDIGEMVENQIFVIDRTSSIHKLPNGQFFSPEKVECILSTCASIYQSLVTIVDETVIAIVVPSLHILTRLQSNEITFQSVKLQINNEIKDRVRGKLMRFEVPSVVLIDSTVWSRENALLTCNYKLQRNMIIQRFENQIHFSTCNSPILDPGHLSNRDEDGQANIIEYDYKYVVEAIIAIVTSKIDMMCGKNGKIDYEVLNSSSLYELGVHSISALQIIQQIQKFYVKLLTSKSINHVHDLLSNKIERITIPLLLSFSISSLRSYFNDITYNNNVESDVNHINDAQSLLEMIQSDISQCLSDLTSINPISNHLNNSNGILLTGSTGFLGRFLLKSQLEHATDRTIYCIVRSRDHDHARSRVLKSLSKIKNFSVSEEMKQRIVAISGDLRYPKFGMKEDNDYQFLQSHISEVIHSASDIKFYSAIEGYQFVRSSNVISMRNILHFSLSSLPPKHIHYISTIGALKHDDHAAILLFSQSPPSPPPLHLLYSLDAYSLSKSVAEHLLITAIALWKTLPQYLTSPTCEYNINTSLFCIYRLPLLTWDEFGSYNPSDWLQRLIDSCLLSKIVPSSTDVSSPIPYLPVDRCAEMLLSAFIKCLNCSVINEGCIFDLVVDSMSISVIEVLETLQENEPRLTSVPFASWAEIMKQNDFPFSPLSGQLITPLGHINPNIPSPKFKFGSSPSNTHWRSPLKLYIKQFQRCS